MFDLRLTETPFVYYPKQPDRAMQRISMFDNEREIAFVDLFIENDWAHFVFVWLDHEYRDDDTIWYYIENAFKFDLGVTKIYWFNIVPRLVSFVHKIADVRPDLTFAATGATNVILNG